MVFKLENLGHLLLIAINTLLTIEAISNTNTCDLQQIMWLTEPLHHAFQVPAKVSEGPDNTKAKRGTTVELKAEISGEPPPDVAWLKDGDDIEEDDRVFFDIGDTNIILTIKNAKMSDAGKYEVFVQNILGTDQSFARVDIL